MTMSWTGILYVGIKCVCRALLDSQLGNWWESIWQTRTRYPMDDAKLSEMAKIVFDQLGRQESLFVARVAAKHPDRFATLMMPYSGQAMAKEDFASLVLRLCKRIVEGDPS